MGGEVGDQVGDQGGVLDDADAVADAFGVEEVDRVPDRLRAGRLAGVGDDARIQNATQERGYR